MDIEGKAAKIRLRIIKIGFIILACFLLPVKSFASDVAIIANVPLSSQYAQSIASNSTISANPSSQYINGHIIVSVVISDGKSLLQNHKVKIAVIGVNGVSLTQLSNTTNSSGLVYADISSTVSGNFEIYAIDQTYSLSDNKEILIIQNANISFSTNSVSVITGNIGNFVPSPVQTTPTQTITQIPTQITPTPEVRTTFIPTPVITNQTGDTSQQGLSKFIMQLFKIFGFNSCLNIQIILLIFAILLIPLLAIVFIQISKKDKLLLSGLYGIIYLLIIILLKFLCLAIGLSLVIWLLLFLIFIKLAKYIVKRND